MNERGFKGVWMCAAVYMAHDLAPIEKLILVEIDSLTTGDCACHASNDHFASLLRITESRADHLLSGLTRKGYLIRVDFNGRSTHRVVAPQFSSNPKTSALFIKQSQQSRVAKNNNSELLDNATQDCPKQQGRAAKNDNQRIPIENTNREHKTTTMGNAIADGRDKSSLSSSSLALADKLATEYGFSFKQKSVLIGYIDSRGEDYVRTKAQIVRSQPRRNVAGSLLAALRDDWQMPVDQPPGNGPPSRDARLAAAEALARERGWKW